MEKLIYQTLVIDQDNKLCCVDDKEITLTSKEYELLVMLVSKPNFVHSREEIINKIWNKPVSNRVVDTNITRLRHKLGEYSKNIYTRIGYGYGFKTKQI